MICRVTIVLAIPALLQAAAVPANDPVDFDRYRIIVTRQPFGIEAPPAPAATSNAPLPAAVTSLKLTGLVRDEDGTLCAGLVDMQSKKNYLLPIGGTEDGIQVVEADYDGEQIRIRKDGQDYWINMSGDTTPGGAGRTAPTPSSSAAIPAPVPAPGGAALSLAPPRGPVPSGPTLGTGLTAVARWNLSYAERHRLREEERRKKEEARQKAEQERSRATNAASTATAQSASNETMTLEEVVEALRAYGTPPAEEGAPAPAVEDTPAPAEEESPPPAADTGE